MNTINLNSEEIANICRENDVAMLAVVGSVARGEATEQSDVDLLVRFSERKGLLALVRLERVFSETLGRKTDSLTEAAISPHI